MPRFTFLLAVFVIAVAGVMACGGDDEDDTNGEATATQPPAEGQGTPPPLQNGAQQPPGSAVETDCAFEVPPGVEIDCGYIDVAERRDTDTGGSIRLQYAIVRSQADDVADDPLVYLAGGPGQSALELIPMAYGDLYEPLVGNRDLIIFDQRGTGLTEPSLACEEFVVFARDALTQGLSQEEIVEGSEEALEACRTRLEAAGIDFAAYNSRESAADLDQLREALGYDEWNLYGLSYGSRLALTAMRDFPDGIRAVVLDSAYPVEANLYAEAPDNAARAIEGLFALCSEQANCATRFGDLSATFSELVQSLNERPASISLTDLTTGEAFESQITGDDMAGFLFQGLYQTDLIPFLPEIIDRAAAGSFGTVGLIQSAFLAQLEIVSTGMQIAVQCQEEITFTDAEALEQAVAGQPELEGFFRASPTLGPALIDICRGWEAGDAGPEENEAVVSAVPAFVVAGSLDPITPPRWGEDVSVAQENAFYFEFPYTGHGIVPAQACAAAMMHAFLDDPASEPDSGCIAQMEAPAFTAGDVQVEMEPYENPLFGFSGVAPAGWAEVFPGVHQESLLVHLVQQVVPNLNTETLLQQLMMQTGLPEPPEPEETLTTAQAEWSIYRFEELGQVLFLALADREQGLLVVQLVSNPERSDVYRAGVFVPAIEAFEPDF